MKKILLQFATVFLSAALCLPTCFATRTQEPIVQVGLAYGDGALTSANLQNNAGYGSGYRFGYFDKDLEFVELGYTAEDVEKITMLRASEIYFNGYQYSTDVPSGGYDTIGCYHVVVDYADNFEEAWSLAQMYEDGFVSWVNGGYQVRQGAYETKEEAEEAMAELEGSDVKGTSAYAVNVVETGDTQILFQFDGGSEYALGVMPDVTGEEDVRTWFKGYKYHGGFRYERIGGGDLTVVNIVDIETYIQGVIPYEMSNNWPLEALKAQAICARSYAYNNIQEQKHTRYHFDLCSTVDCQVYHGVGTENQRYQANELTDRAVEETAGEYALYDGKPILAYYSSSHGGASERIDNVWNSKYYPYLCGVIDPYEAKVAHLNSYSYWTKTWTKNALTQRLRDRGYALNTWVDSIELTYSKTGNVIESRVVFENGKDIVFTPKMNWGTMSLFGISSLHFTINGQGVETGSTVSGSAVSVDGISVNESDALDLEENLYVISGTGKTSRLDLENTYIISGSGKVTALELEDQEEPTYESTAPIDTVVTITGDKFVLEGAGNGHQLGMSQYGAYAMAEEGFTYDEIVEFYYPGTRVDIF